MKKTSILNLITRDTVASGFMKKIAFCLFLLTLVLSGTGLGLAAGDYILAGLISGNRRFGLLLYKPSFHYLETIKLLNGDNELKRAEGYYALYDSGKINVAYLMDRYRIEQSIYIRRTIVWLMGFSNDPRGTMIALSSVYSDAPMALKKEMVRTMKRVDARTLNDFVNKNKIKQDVLKAL